MIVPDAIEPIVGWRCWSLNDAGQLESPIQDSDTPWLPGERKEAKCSSPIFSWLGETSDTEGAELDPALGEYDFLRDTKHRWRVAAAGFMRPRTSRRCEPSSVRDR